ALRVAASATDPGEEPDWLVVGMELTLSLPPDCEPGAFPDRTALDQEGCGGLDPIHILEAWSRHTLLWLNTIEDAEGRGDLHREWEGLAWNLRDTVSVACDGTRIEGAFLGVDENFGMLLKTGDATRLLPLSSLLEDV
ncbi:MAG: DUF4444 domain-containing protein, partial [Albidovulum sp.]|uniref:DUF4444 domain-containing protein n=1 Tax=Albidovulum sp. TaxID=1872424 RepID=UPI003C8E366C